jgi:cytochrome c oxidase cbb3-type subunit 1
MSKCGDDPVRDACGHALAWLVVANGVGLWLALMLWFPALNHSEWSYGRWVPVHLNLQLYGWTSLPLIAWLFRLYKADAESIRPWASAAVWAWSASLVVGAVSWLSGMTSGKIFLDWTGGALVSFLIAQVILWVVLVAAWKRNQSKWDGKWRMGLLVVLMSLGMVPVSLWFASSPAVYPSVDRSTGGPTGASLLGSSLIVVGLMLAMPRVARLAGHGNRGSWLWIYFGVSWLAFFIFEHIGGTHRDVCQLISMAMLLPWVWIIPRDWSGYDWPASSKNWRHAMIAWWGLLVLSGWLMYQPGVLDRVKFTQALVGHSHLAMAGFTSSFCMLLMGLLTGSCVGSRWSVLIWNMAVLGMVIALKISGWFEGGGWSWMLEAPLWREIGWGIRAGCGLVMWLISVKWWLDWNQDHE